MNLGIDVETTKLPYIHPWQTESTLVCVSVCNEKGETKTWLVDHKDATLTPREVADDIQEYIKPYRRLVAHNLSFDYMWLRTLGVVFDSHLLYCTMVGEYLINRQQKQQGLALSDLCEKYKIPAKKDKVKMYWDAGIDTPDIDSECLSVYCEQDAANALMIFKQQVPKIKKDNLSKLVSLEMNSLPILADMCMAGMKLNLDKLQDYQQKFDKDLNEIDRELSELLGIANIGSGPQLSASLFGGYLTYTEQEEVRDSDGNLVRYKSGKKAGEVKTKLVEKKVWKDGAGFSTKGVPETAVEGVYSTAMDVLLGLKAKTQKQEEILTLLKERSRIQQLKSTYFDGLLNKQLNGYVHPSLNQALTRTGRLSCSNPNLQNQPRGNTGPVKECFITRFEV